MLITRRRCFLPCLGFRFTVHALRRAGGRVRADEVARARWGAAVHGCRRGLRTADPSLCNAPVHPLFSARRARAALVVAAPSRAPRTRSSTALGIACSFVDEGRSGTESTASRQRYRRQAREGRVQGSATPRERSSTTLGSSPPQAWSTCICSVGANSTACGTAAGGAAAPAPLAPAAAAASTAAWTPFPSAASPFTGPPAAMSARCSLAAAASPAMPSIGRSPYSTCVAPPAGACSSAASFWASSCRRKSSGAAGSARG